MEYYWHASVIAGCRQPVCDGHRSIAIYGCWLLWRHDHICYHLATDHTQHTHTHTHVLIDNPDMQLTLTSTSYIATLTFDPVGTKP